MWENGRRRPGIDEVEALDHLYRAHGALVDLALALGTPCGLPPRHTWAHNPQGPSGPHWAWLRPRPHAGRVVAVLRWAAFGVHWAEACDDRGLIVTTPVSMPNPAVWVHLREPGWVDFGRGEIPPQLGVPMLDALARAQVAGGGHSPAGLVAPWIVDRFISDRHFAERVLGFFGSRPDLVRQVFSTTEGWNRVTRLVSPRADPTDPHDPFSGAAYRRLREARSLSQHDAARLATELLPDEPVTDDQLRLLERGGNPRRALLRSRLDAVYRADGFTCMEEVEARQENRPRGPQVPFTFDFPSFWIGPVWITVHPARRSPEGNALLVWDEQHKELFLGGPNTVTCRRPTRDSGPLLVFCPSGWNVTAGLGSDPLAWDVNHGWQRDGMPAEAGREQHDVDEVFLSWFGRTKDEFRRFILQSKHT